MIKEVNEINCKSFVRAEVFFIAVIAGIIFSCTSANFEQASFEREYKNGNYTRCIKMIKGRDYGKANRVLKNMDIAVLAHYAKDYKTSVYHFNESERMIEQGDLRSIALFESFYLNILNSLNYYHLGKFEDAAAEIRKADDEKIRAGRESKIPEWYISDESVNVDLIRSINADEEPSEELKEAYSKFGLKPAELNEGIPRKPLITDLYKGSSTAYYLGGLFRNANGDSEGARLDGDYLTVLNNNVSLKKTLEEENGNANLNIIAFSGVIAEKQEAVQYFPPESPNGFPNFLAGIYIYIQEIPFYLPPIRFKSVYTKAGENITDINNVETEIKNTACGQTVKHSFVLLEDFGEDLKRNVALKARKEFLYSNASGIISKLAAALSSGTAIFIARAALERAADPITQTIANAALTFAEAALPAALEKIDSRIKADTRQVKFLPAKSYAVNVKLPEGIYDVKIRYLKEQTLIYEELISNVEIKNKNLNLLESICLK